MEHTEHVKNPSEVLTPSRMNFLKEVISDPAAISDLAEKFERLSARAVSQNVFVVPAAVEASWRYLTGKTEWASLVLYWTMTSDGEKYELVGYFPLISGPAHWAGLWVADGLSNAMIFQGIPYLDNRYAEEVLVRFLEDESSRGKRLHGLRFRLVPSAGPFCQLFLRAAERADWSAGLFSKHERPALDASRSGDETFNKVFSKNRRRQFSRYKRRLEEKGDVRFEVVESQDRMAAALKAFLQIEASGWKRAAGTAILCRKNWSAHFGDWMNGLVIENKCKIANLHCNDTLVASGLLLTSGDVAWYAKVGFNEDFADCSPGMLLTVELSRYFCDGSEITFIDSCAVQDSPLTGRVWTDRINVVDIVAFPHKGKTANLLFKLVKAQTYARMVMKRIKKNITDVLTKYRIRKRGCKPNSTG